MLDKKPLVALKATTTLDKALDVLQMYHILSVPIENNAYNGSDSSVDPFIGVLDITDILVYLAFDNFKDDSSEITSDSLNGSKLAQVSVDQVFGVANEMATFYWHSGLFIAESDRTIWDTIDLFKGGFQRVLVKTEIAGKPSFKVLSQTDVVSFLASAANSHASTRDIFGKTLKECDLIQPEQEFNELCRVFADESALSAYRKMIRHKADAIAVVQRETGELLTTLSPSDLRYLHQKTGSFELLLRPVQEFLENVHHGVLRYPVTVNETNSVGMAMSNCVLWKIHRVWVIDSSNRPVASVRLQDLLARFQS